MNILYGGTLIGQSYYCFYRSIDSSTTVQLTESLKALNLSAPPSGVSPAQFFKQLLSVIEKVNPNQRSALIGEPLFNGTLSSEQWKSLHGAAMDLGKHNVLF